jgi:hypothetical protein
MYTEKDRKNNENGQIIVLLAVSLVVVLVVAALAIDGGMIYTERRQAQNAADAASLAGGGEVLYYMEKLVGDVYQMEYSNFDCTPLIPLAKEEARLVAANNNFNIPYLGYKVIYQNKSEKFFPSVEGYNENADEGVIIICDMSKRNLGVQVKITSSISTAFAHLIFPGPLKTTNIAVTKVVPRTNVGYGFNIISLNYLCSGTKEGLIVSGTTTITLRGEGGGMFSYSCIDGNGTVTVIAENGEILSVMEFSEENKPKFIPDVLGGQEPLTIDFPDPPKCPDSAPISLPNIGNNNIENLNPGNYTGIKMTAGNLTFGSGLYCFTGDIDISGGNVTGESVTFYMEDGNIKITGGLVKLAAPGEKYADEKQTDADMPGMLIYKLKNVDGKDTITIVGNNGSSLSGTILAPTTSVAIGGTADPSSYESEVCDFIDGENVCQAVTFATQIIALNVKVSGTSAIDFLFDKTKFYYNVGSLYLEK